jgi:ferredoxin
MSKITFLVTGEIHDVPSGMDLLKAYQINPRIPFKFGCTLGNCGVCAIKIVSGAQCLSRMTKQEMITLKDKTQDGYRLACQCAIEGDIVIN